MHVHMQYTQACICTYCDLLFTICIIYVYTYIYNYSFLCFYMRCSVEMFLNVSSLFFITKIIDIVKMTPLVFEHVSTLTKNSVCVCACLLIILISMHVSVWDTRWDIWDAYRIPPRSLTQPLKSYLPNRKVVFQRPFFRGYVKLRGCRSVSISFKYTLQK